MKLSKKYVDPGDDPAAFNRRAELYGRVRSGLAAGGRWIRSYGALRLPKKPKDFAILDGDRLLANTGPVRASRVTSATRSLDRLSRDAAPVPMSVPTDTRRP